MTTNAFVGEIYLYRGDGSPVSYTKVCQVFSISGVGQTNALIDATTFCSTGREYISGLADGTEITIEANYESDAMEASPQGIIYKMIDDVKNKVTREFKVVDENASPHLAFVFSGTCLSWTLNPSVDDRNTITFTVKVSGDITIS
jgi:hypothetical protein